MSPPGDAEPQHPLLDGTDDLPPIQDRPMLEYFVIKQEVNLEINFQDRRIDGTTNIFVVTFSDKVDEVLLDAAHCDIDTSNVTVTEMREVQGEPVEGQRRKAFAEYHDPYLRLSQPRAWNLRADHHDLRRIRARSVFHSRKVDAPAENREFEGCTPVYGSLKVNLRLKGDQDRPRLIIRKSTSTLDAAERSHKQFKITVPFVNKDPRDGLHFVGVDALDNRFTHMYTRHSIHPGTASCIFPCIDDHGARCDFRISIKYPRTLGDALRQALATQQDGRSSNGNSNGNGNGSNSDRMQVDGQDRFDRHTRLAEEDKLREMTAVCSGFLVEETVDPEDDHKKIMIFEPEKKVSVQKLGFAVGPFEHIDLSSEFRTDRNEEKLGISALKVHAYCLPRRADWVRNTAAAVTLAADFFTFTFAKYPFENFKMCFLDDLVEDTVALHSLAFISNRLLFPEDIIDTEMDVTRKIIYTLTYQWTGINMIPNTRNDLWLVIGIAHFMTNLFMRQLCGNNEHRFRMKTLADRLVEADVERPSLFDLGPHLHLGDFELDFMHLKASVVFFILDKRLSKASGGHGLTRILQKLLTKVQIEASDRSNIWDSGKFKASCEKAVKTRLESFWNQWIYSSGCPKFDVKAKFNKKRLCVELTMSQIQSQMVAKAGLRKEDFLRKVKERRAGLKIGQVQPLFTGPMTVRIHEADGTPYEHILEIREDASRSTKFEIPYNTKYKRLKRTRRMKEKHNAGLSVEVSENPDDALLYCLGDVLQSAEEQRDWELIDWDPETERKMDQESYEWIRVDADFEWACGMNRTLEPYMYVSQLQQDRDVVAQQDAMLYLSHGPLHPIASGFLVRTLLDHRYFHGIRTMAAHALTRQANIKDIPGLGLRQLLRAFREMFCYDQTNQPRNNDFSDKKQYKVRCAIIRAIAEVRDATSRCPFEGRRLILDQLLFNNNEENPYSDHYYIATLIEALATSMIPRREEDWFQRQGRVPTEEERDFMEEAMEQIDRILRRDEWTHSYQNIWTIAGLDAKQRLMKAEVIPKNYAEFGQYLLDGTKASIRIKCFEALIDLGAMMEPTFFTFLLYSLMTDRSPHVRHKLVQAVASGLAAIAFGEHAKDVQKEPAMDEPDDAFLVVQDSAQEIAARKEKFARKENLDAALKALRREVEEAYGADERHYSTAMRKALDHKGLGRAEVENLLDLAAMMFEEARSWVITLNLPKAWKAERPAQQLVDRLMVNFKSYYKLKPKSSDLPPPPPPVQDVKPVPPVPRPPSIQRTPSIKINMKPSQPPKPAAAAATATAAAPLPKPVQQPKPQAATPSVPQLPKPTQPPKLSPPTLSTPKPTPSPPLPGTQSQQRPGAASATPANGAADTTLMASHPAPRPSNGAPPKLVIKKDHFPSGGILSKRPRPDKLENLPPASKRPKVEASSSSSSDKDKQMGTPSIVVRPRRMVTLKTKYPKRLAAILGKSLTSSASASASPRTALPSGPTREHSEGNGGSGSGRDSNKNGRESSHGSYREAPSNGHARDPSRGRESSNGTGRDSSSHGSGRDGREGRESSNGSGSAGSREKLAVKPARKPLPSGEAVVRKPLPSPLHMSTPPPSTSKVLIKSHSSSTSLLKSGTSPIGSPTASGTPSARPRIKIVKKPPPPSPKPSAA